MDSERALPAFQRILKPGGHLAVIYMAWLPDENPVVQRSIEKQDVIRSVLEDAYSQVMNMDDAAYFEMLGKMLDKYMLAQDGAICFSKRDLDRMPKSFAEKIDASAKAKGGKLVISEEARKIDSVHCSVHKGHLTTAWAEPFRCRSEDLRAQRDTHQHDGQARHHNGL